MANQRSERGPQARTGPNDPNIISFQTRYIYEVKSIDQRCRGQCNLCGLVVLVRLSLALLRLRLRTWRYLLARWFSVTLSRAAARVKPPGPLPPAGAGQPAHKLVQTSFPQRPNGGPQDAA